MELDELKQAWQQQSPSDIDAHNKKITDMIQHKSYGPLASLKSKYERYFLLIVFCCGYIIYDFASHPERWHNNIILNPWFICPLLMLDIINRVCGYFLINKLQYIELPVRTELKNKVAAVERSLTIQKWLGVFGLALICIGFEIVTHQNKNSNAWADVPVYLRAAVYLAYIASGYFFQRYSYQKQFGRHINYLKEILEKMQ
ncbi:hypothetical protein [Parafilimonas sp.]|uniref:hypothetical protein n=1 Tax=Parafilimonas sp. TaxID=1969739 RepID=UPI0039E33584